jgi:hypothetical protein
VFPLTIDPSLTKRTTDPASYDTILSNAWPTTNFGAHPRLAVGPQANYVIRSFTQFDLGDIPSNASVSNMGLRLTKTLSSSCAPKLLAAARVTSPWGPSTTCNAHPSATNDDRGVVYDDCTSTNPTPALDVTTIGRGWVNQSFPNYGLMLYADETDLSAYKEFSCARSTSATPARPTISAMTSCGSSVQLGRRARSERQLMNSCAPTCSGTVTDGPAQGEPAELGRGSMTKA